MSDGSDTDKGTGTPREPDEAALAAMSNQELLTLGGKIDGVETVVKEPRWPVEGTQAEKRAARTGSLMIALTRYSAPGPSKANRISESDR